MKAIVPNLDWAEQEDIGRLLQILALFSFASGSDYRHEGEETLVAVRAVGRRSSRASASQAVNSAVWG